MAWSGRRGGLLGIVVALGLACGIAGCTDAPAQPDVHASITKIESCPAAGTVLPAVDSDFGQELIRLVGKQAFYPDVAFKLGQSGEVGLCMELSRRGFIQKALVNTSSGYARLDGAALYAVGRAGAADPIKKVPDSLGGGSDPVWFEVPVSFRIAGDDAKTSPSTLTADARDQGCSRTGSLVTAKDPWFATSEFQNYMGRISTAIQKRTIYPPDAVAQHETGRTMVCLVINRDGSIRQARIWQSGGDPLFDGIVLIAVGLAAAQGDIGPLPDVVPSTITRLPFTLPVDWGR